MAAGIVIKHKRKSSAFVNGELAAGEMGLDTANGVWYFSTNGTTVSSIASGGSGSPSGNDGEVQYKNGTSFAGASNVEIDNGNLSLIATPDPSIPSSGRLTIYSGDIGGRVLPKFMPPSGLDSPLQTGLFFNNVSLIGQGGATTVGVIGCTVTNVGTISNPNIAATNLKTQTRRFTNTSAGTAGALASTRIATLECWRGNATGLGGFFVVSRFGLTTLAAGMRAFFGLSSTATTAPTNVNPTTTTTDAKIGMAINANTGNWNLIHNTAGVAPTVIALGASFPVNTTDLLEMILFAKPNDSVVTYRIRNLSTGAEVTGTLSTNLPASTSLLGRLAWATNNATAGAVAWDISKFGLETDY